MPTAEFIVLAIGLIVILIMSLGIILWLVAEEKIRKDREKFDRAEKKNSQEDRNANA